MAFIGYGMDLGKKKLKDPEMHSRSQKKSTGKPLKNMLKNNAY